MQRSFPVLANFNGCSGREDSVNVGGDRDHLLVAPFPMMRAEHAAKLIGMNIFKSDLAKAIQQPVRAGRFFKWRRRYSCQLELRASELALVGAQPTERGVDIASGSNVCHLPVGA